MHFSYDAANVSRRGLFTAVLSLALLSPGTRPAAAQVTGSQYEVTLSGKEDGKPITASVVVLTSGPKARLVFGGDYAEYKTGDYLVTTDAGLTFTHVSAKSGVVRRVDAAGLRKEVDRQQKGVSVGEPKTTVTTPGAGRQQISRTYKINARKFLVTFGVNAADTFHYVFEKAAADTPSYNPVINLLTIKYSTVLFKRDGVTTSALVGEAVPRGWVFQATLSSKLTGSYKSNDTVTATASRPKAAPVTADTFTAPDESRAR